MYPGTSCSNKSTTRSQDRKGRVSPIDEAADFYESSLQPSGILTMYAAVQVDRADYTGQIRYACLGQTIHETRSHSVALFLVDDAELSDLVNAEQAAAQATEAEALARAKTVRSRRTSCLDLTRIPADCLHHAVVLRGRSFPVCTPA